MKNICKRTLCAALALGMALLPAGATNWGLWYGNGLHQPPNGEDTVQTLAKYGAYYMGSADEKTLLRGEITGEPHGAEALGERLAARLRRQAEEET